MLLELFLSKGSWISYFRGDLRAKLSESGAYQKRLNKASTILIFDSDKREN